MRMNKWLNVMFSRRGTKKFIEEEARFIHKFRVVLKKGFIFKKVNKIFFLKVVRSGEWAQNPHHYYHVKEVLLLTMKLAQTDYPCEVPTRTWYPQCLRPHDELGVRFLMTSYFQRVFDLS